MKSAINVTYVCYLFWWLTYLRLTKHMFSCQTYLYQSGPYTYFLNNTHFNNQFSWHIFMIHICLLLTLMIDIFAINKTPKTSQIFVTYVHVRHIYINQVPYTYFFNNTHFNNKFSWHIFMIHIFWIWHIFSLIKHNSHFVKLLI